MPSSTAPEGAVRKLRAPQPWAAFGLSLALTVGAWASLRWQERRAVRSAFTSQAHDLESRLRRSLDSQANLLRACQGFFEAHPDATEAQWDAFVGRLWSEDRNAGLMALAQAPVLPVGDPPPGDPPGLWRALAQRSGAPPLSAPLGFSAPIDQDAWDPGVRDLMADPATSAAALDALARDRASATPCRPLRFESRAPRTGLLLLAPIFPGRAPRRGAGPGPGLVVGAYDLESVLAQVQPDDGSLFLELGDAAGARVSVPVPGFTVGRDAMTLERPVSFGGRYWTLKVTSSSGFRAGRSGLSSLALGVGLLASLLIFIAVSLLARGRQRAEALLGELGLSEARYRDLVQGIRDLVYRADLEGRFTFVNEAALPLLGYRPEELEGRMVRDFMAPESRRGAREALPRIRAGEVLQELPVAFLCKDGSQRWLAASAAALHDPEGRIIGTQGTMRDVTAARLAQRALEESEQKFRAFAETLSCIILLFDEKIRYVNPYATRMLGWAEEEILDKPFWSIVHPDDQDMVRTRGEARVRGDQVLPRYEFRVLTKSGETRWVDFTAGRVSFGGHSFGLGTVFDVTDRVKAEEGRLRMERRLLEAQKLESLGLLAGGVAHDFNNLLAAILGNAELAEELAPQDSPLLKPLGQIQKACLRASELTRQMLAYAGQGKFLVEPLELGQAVEGIAELLRASIPKTVDLELALASGPLWLEGDGAQLQQVILNLITNASEAIGPAGGTVILRTGRRALEPKDAAGLRAAESLKPGPMIYLEVEDTGQGMDAATLDRIFDPFFTTKFQGRGLGLAAMQGIVRGHGGAIAVQSAPGKGTTFRIYFPELVKG